MNKALAFTTQTAIGIAAVLTLAAGKAMAMNVQDGVDAAKAEGVPTQLFGDTGFIGRLTTFILAAIGIVSVVMLIFGGFRYIISGGDAKKVTDAKNTILYAIIGLVIALLAYAIVNFIVYVVTNGAISTDPSAVVSPTPTPEPTITPTAEATVTPSI